MEFGLRPKLGICLSILTGWVLALPVYGEISREELFGMCYDAATGPMPLPQDAGTSADGEDLTAVIQADSSESLPDGEYRFSGNVEMQQQNTYIKADNLRYHRLQETLEIRDNIYVERDDFAAFGDNASFALRQETGFINNTRYHLLGRHARGKASEIRVLSSKQFQLNHATYTTCMADQESWRLNARSVDLDYADNVGTAKHVWLNFMDVPVLYFPYLSFPIAGRKSGLLVPEFASNQSLGSHMKIPWYWNIAPNHDATLTLHPTSERSTQYLAEYRFLTPASSGVLNAEYLPGDGKYAKFARANYARDRVSSNRYYYSLAAAANLGRGWYFETDTRDVSDAQYFTDFGDRYASSLINHIERRVSLRYQNPSLSFLWRAVSFKTIDEQLTVDEQPYELLPQIILQSRAYKLLGGDYRAYGEVSRFYRSGGDNIWGDRYRLYQDLGYLWEKAAYFLRPRLFHHTVFYDLNNSNPGKATKVGRAIPGFSLDSGLFFERDLTLAGADFVQTLEPRLFYLYVPYVAQQDQVTDNANRAQVFDTSTTTLSYSNMYLENRFSGGDRVGDANQFTLGLTSRLLRQDTGRDVLTAGIGRIYYLKDQKVNLPQASSSLSPRMSDTFGTVHWQPRDYYSAVADVRWNSYYHGLTEGNFRLGYHPMRYNIFNLGYRLTRDPATGKINQLDTDISTVWRVATRVNFIGRRSRSLINDVEKDVLYGIEYENCCWTFRVVRRRYLTNEVEGRTPVAADYNDSVMFQLVLKGLTSVGSSVDGLLRNDEYGITGY